MYISRMSMYLGRYAFLFNTTFFSFVFLKVKTVVRYLRKVAN